MNDTRPSYIMHDQVKSKIPLIMGSDGPLFRRRPELLVSLLFSAAVITLQLLLNALSG